MTNNIGRLRGRLVARGWRSKVRVVLLSMGTMVIASSCLLEGVDNMYPTSNATWACIDGSMGDPFCQTDNSSLTYGLTSGTTAQHQYITAMLNAEFGPTDLSVSRQTPIVYSGNAETDIVYQIGATMPSGVNGITWCDDHAAGRKCDQHYVRLKSTRVHADASTACHESAHAVGLTHGSNAAPTVDNSHGYLRCLRTPGTSDSGLGEHNQNQINGTY